MNEKTKNILVLILIGFILFTTISISGCVQQGAIKSQEDVGQAVTNMSTNIEDLSTTLNDIDKSIG
jgi:outer membrane lipoprotein-sorting protein